MHPAAEAVMVVVPLQPAAKINWPVEELIALLPVMLAASILYVMEVLLDALAVYVTVPAPWHLTELGPATKAGMPTVGVIETK